MTDRSEETASGPTFLVVDDDAEIRRLICLALAQLEPALLMEAEHGVAAQRHLRQQAVDVVITDVRMPEMDGHELMRWAQEHCPGPLWIVLSGLDTFDAAVEALQLGAFDFLVKPLRVGRLRVAVRNALNQIRLRRERERLYQQLEQTNTQLSRQVDQLTQLCRILEDQSELIREDLARAEVIQRALLPQQPPQLDGWKVETLYRPGRHVGGDLYDIVALDDRHLGLMLADAAGHGVAAAMLSVLLKHRLCLRDPATGAPLEPAEVLYRANSSLREDNPAPGAFITAVYLLLDRITGRARLAAAGHPPVLWVHDGEVRLLDRTGPALGLTSDARFEQQEVGLGRGDRLLLYTDGLLDGGPSAPTHDDLGEALTRSNADPAELLRSFHEAATRDASFDPDDMTIILLERAEGTSRFDAASTVERRPAAASAPEPLRILEGESAERGFVSISGTGSWLRGQAFFDAVEALATRHREVMLDLAGCEYLDSTCLGTLYELVAAYDGKIRLQRVPTRLRQLFEELSMDAVIDRIEPRTIPLPEAMHPVSRRPEDPAEQARRLLAAHEILASLSDDNREQFQQVVSTLRQDLRVLDRRR